ncbi:MAG TPA: sulfite exporter TauE/SafE family protein [Ohtaekwangia sp.]|uniref:sulfite exporter TauE/SafE family protein n=1 Tax=Ohtaekwangia sp. TaxID=2066019 RepID=UPI002F943A77
MDFYQLVLIGSFFLIALVYASVGFGGGSSYLAILAQPVFLLSQDVIRPTALLCNIIVVTAGTIIFYREGKIVWKEVWPFLIVSIPMAYIGGFWKLKDDTFFVLLGITLLIAAILLWIQPERIASSKKRNYNTTGTNIALGGGIGFLSGLVSIGGGIFLSPVLHFLRWADARKISALASLFILVNSISGLAGQFQAGLPGISWKFILPLLAAVFLGGQIGSRLGAQKFKPLYIKRITAVLILVAAINILKDHL